MSRSPERKRETADETPSVTSRQRGNPNRTRMVPAMFLLSLNSCESSYEVMGGDYEATNGGWHELDFQARANGNKNVFFLAAVCMIFYFCGRRRTASRRLVTVAAEPASRSSSIASITWQMILATSSPFRPSKRIRMTDGEVASEDANSAWKSESNVTMIASRVRPVDKMVASLAVARPKSPTCSAVMPAASRWATVERGKPWSS